VSPLNGGGTDILPLIKKTQPKLGLRHACSEGCEFKTECGQKLGNLCGFHLSWVIDMKLDTMEAIPSNQLETGLQLTVLVSRVA
jgi:hypothetical protein